MAVPKVETKTVKGKLTSKTLSGGEAWRLVHNEAGEVTHLFRSGGITHTPGTMKCFKTNEEAGVEVEAKSLKCYKAAVKDTVVESLSELKTNVEVTIKPGEKVFYSADLNDFEMHVEKQKWDISKVKDILPIKGILPIKEVA